MVTVTFSPPALPALAMSRKKISTTIYVTPDQADRLKLLHERTKVPVAVYIREGIDLVLLHYQHMLPGQLPLDAAPPPAHGAPRHAAAAPAAPAVSSNADDDERSHAVSAEQDS
jgi:hypothetical protein